MRMLLTAALVLASLLSAQAARAETSQTVITAPQEIVAPAPEPIVISWDRVGGKERWWV